MFKPDIALYFASNLRPHPKTCLDRIALLMESDVGLRGASLKEDLSIAFTLMNCLKSGNIKERFFAHDPKDRCVVFYAAKEIYDQSIARIVIKSCVEVYRQMAAATLTGGAMHELELRLMEDIPAGCNSRSRTEAYKDACDIIQKLIIAGHSSHYHELACHELIFKDGDIAYITQPTEQILNPGDRLELFQVQQTNTSQQESGTISQIAG